MIAAAEPAVPETTAVQAATQSSELLMLGPDLAITPDLMPPPRPHDVCDRLPQPPPGHGTQPSDCRSFK
ncbi:MAG: hypothetical protein HC771_21130, partial [Synechococcales cyanobacterium CRU_2_2]|nr:hypothetical protein [Synechococcales cyanobacterium CRU_2_2]